MCPNESDLVDIEPTQRILVVLPQKGVHFKAYVAEYLASLTAKPNLKLYYLDLSNLHPDFWAKGYRNAIRRLVYKRSLERLITRLCKDNNIEIIRLSARILHKDTVEEFELSENHEYIRETLVSTHSMITGGDSNLENWLPEDLLNLETFLFKLAYQTIRRSCVTYKIDLVVTVNGRHLIDSAVRLAAKQEGISVNLLETGSGRTYGWYLYKTSPHNYEEDVTRIETEWQEAKEDIRQALLGLHSRMSGDRGDGYSWNPHEGAEETWIFLKSLKQREFIVYFPSTQYELVAGSKFKSSDSFGGSQVSAFRSLAEVARLQEKLLVVRGHPSGGYKNLEKVEDQVWSKECEQFGAIYIPSNSAIDSTSLMYKSMVNVVYQSWVGAESIANGRPTLILGSNSHLSHFFPKACAHSREDLFHKIKNPPQVDPRDSFPMFRAWGFGGRRFEVLKFTTSGKFFNSEGKAVEELRFPFEFLKKALKVSLYKKRAGAQEIVWK